MRLTKKKAIEISIELWTWLAETGEESKYIWEGWDKYGEMDAGCAFCEYVARHRPRGCGCCPYWAKFHSCQDYGSPYDKWTTSETISTRKKYAKLFLEQLKQL